MITLAQDKALAHVFTIYHSDTWLNLFNPIKAHIKPEDTLCEFYGGYNYEYLKKVLTTLSEEFQDTYNTGFQDGLTYEGE